MTADENKRIAALTTGAIKTTTEAAIMAMMAAVAAAEEKTREMRVVAEQFVAEFEQATNSLAENVNAHVAACQATIDSFNKHHLTILNVDPKEDADATPADPDMMEALGKLHVLASEKRGGA